MSIYQIGNLEIELSIKKCNKIVVYFSCSILFIRFSLTVLNSFDPKWENY